LQHKSEGIYGSAFGEESSSFSRELQYVFRSSEPCCRIARFIL
jgi:hypothetical protein